jgi:hypothetical protein
MEKVYNISELKFTKDYLILVVNNQVKKIKLDGISKKLADATMQERNNFKISPSGYGIHWSDLDEDLSVNGLLKNSK